MKPTPHKIENPGLLLFLAGPPLVMFLSWLLDLVLCLFELAIMMLDWVGGVLQ